MSDRGRGGNRGDYREGRGGGDRGGRGGYGGRGGRGGGGDRGGRGGGGDRGGGRGGFRGGPRGGGRGGRGGFREQSPGKGKVFQLADHTPAPAQNAAIEKLEDETIKAQGTALASLTAAMGKTKLGSTATQLGATALSQDFFPFRPAYGDKGTPVLLWANYFAVNIKAKHNFYRYSLRFSQRGGDGGWVEKELSKRKLYVVVKQLIADLKSAYPKVFFATEYKSQLVATKKLENEVFEVALADERPDNPEVVRVELEGLTEGRVDDMIKYLANKTNDPEDHIFPKYPDTINIINIIFGMGPRSREANSAVGSSRIFPFANPATANLSCDERPLIAARGMFHSVRLGTGRLLLNANVTHGVFKIGGPALKIFQDFGIRAMRRSDMRSAEGRRLRGFAKFLPKTRATATMWVDDGKGNRKEIQRNKAIHGLANADEIKRGSRGRENPPKIDPDYEYPGPKQVSFWMNGDDKTPGKYVTVFAYYKQKYKKTLADLPMFNCGRSDSATFFPAEVITIVPGQSVKAKLTGSETTDMLAFACRSPYFNATHISTEGRAALGLDEPILSSFGITTEKSLLTVRGRVLQTPKISYHAKGQAKPVLKVEHPRSGSWNMRDSKIVKCGSKIERWGFINLHRRHPRPVDKAEVVKFAGELNSMGIPIHSDPLPVNRRQDGPSMDAGAFLRSIDNFFGAMKTNSNMQFILFILDERDTSGLYQQIKVMGDCKYGIHTSIAIGSKFKPMDRDGNIKVGPQKAYFANVALKWNLKAGGVNHQLSQELGIIKDGKTMVVGYDVTHPTNMPAGTDTDVPSLAGLVASIDKHLGQWPAAAWEQTSRKEMVGDRLTEVFRSRLDLWMRHNKNALPDNILVFRDGVSEGQFAQVLEQELPAMRAACAAKYAKNRQPKITILVSVKRHQTRFYPTDPNAKTMSGNTLPGTVVDRGVTQARYWDFFLTAHDALQGTARPAHYTVLLDEVFRARYGAAQAANELERVTHELCYLFGRATKAVSICPPAYYADVVCERARAHRPDMFGEIGAGSEGWSEAGAGGAEEERGRSVHSDLRDSMYYI